MVNFTFIISVKTKCKRHNIVFPMIGTSVVIDVFRGNPLPDVQKNCVIEIN